MESNLYRQTILIDYLVKYPKTTIKQLISDLNYSENTIRTYLTNICKILPKNWSLTINKKIIFVKPTNETAAILKLKLWKNSAIIKIILLLLVEESTTINKVCESLHISKEFCNKTIKYLDKKLENYHLTLSRRPLKIVGTEIAIRYFIYDMLQFFLSNESWHFNVLFAENNYFTSLNHVLDSIEINLGITIPLKYKFDYIIYLTISLYRNTKSSQLNFSIMIHELFKNSIEFEIGNKLINMIKIHYLKMDIIEKQKYHIILPLVMNVNIEKYISGDFNSVRDNLNTYFKLDTIVIEFLGTLNLPIPKQSTNSGLYKLLYEKFKILVLKRILNYNSNELYEYTFLTKDKISTQII